MGAAIDGCSCRSGRCTASPSTTRCRPCVLEHAGRRDDARAAFASEGAATSYDGLGNQWDHGFGGCESGSTTTNPANPNIVWSTCYGNKVTRYDHRTKIARSVAPGMITLDAPPRIRSTLPLVGAAGDRPLQSQQRLLRLQRHLPHQQRRTELARHQPQSLHPGCQPHHRVPAGSSATTWASSLPR